MDNKSILFHYKDVKSQIMYNKKDNKYIIPSGTYIPDWSNSSHNVMDIEPDVLKNSRVQYVRNNRLKGDFITGDVRLVIYFLAGKKVKIRDTAEFFSTDLNKKVTTGQMPNIVSPVDMTTLNKDVKSQVIITGKLDKDDSSVNELKDKIFQSFLYLTRIRNHFENAYNVHKFYTNIEMSKHEELDSLVNKLNSLAVIVINYLCELFNYSIPEYSIVKPNDSLNIKIVKLTNVLNALNAELECIFN